VQVSPHTARALEKAGNTRCTVATIVSDADHCTLATTHLRDTHLQPVDRRAGLFPCSLRPKAHQRVAPPSFAFLPRTGSSSSLATKHQMDVSTVSGQATGPYPLHYRAAFASSILPPAHPDSAPRGLPAPLPRRGYAGYRVPRKHPRSLGLTRTPVAQHLRWRTLDPPSLATYRFGPSHQHLGLVRYDGAAVIHLS